MATLEIMELSELLDDIDGDKIKVRKIGNKRYEVTVEVCDEGFASLAAHFAEDPDDIISVAQTIEKFTRDAENSPVAQSTSGRSLTQIYDSPRRGDKIAVTTEREIVSEDFGRIDFYERKKRADGVLIDSQDKTCSLSSWRGWMTTRDLV